MAIGYIGSAISGLFSSASGMNAGRLTQSVAANNIANANSSGYQAAIVELSSTASGVSGSISIDETPCYETYDSSGKVTTGSNVDLIKEITNLKMGSYMVEANAAAFKVQDETLGTIIDMVA